jgi:hypothetical protein
LRSYPVVGAGNRAECGRRAAHFHRDQHLFLGRQPEAAVFDRNGEPEQPHLAHFADDSGGISSLSGYLILGRDQPLAHETPHGIAQYVERFLVAYHGQTVVSLQLDVGVFDDLRPFRDSRT